MAYRGADKGDSRALNLRLLDGASPPEMGGQRMGLRIEKLSSDPVECDVLCVCLGRCPCVSR